MHHTGINPTTTQWLHMPPLVLATAGCSPPLVFEDADRSTSRIFDGVSSHAQPWRLLAAGSQRGRRRGLLGLLVDGRADDAPRGNSFREPGRVVRRTCARSGRPRLLIILSLWRTPRTSGGNPPPSTSRDYRPNKRAKARQTRQMESPRVGTARLPLLGLPRGSAAGVLKVPGYTSKTPCTHLRALRPPAPRWPWLRCEATVLKRCNCACLAPRANREQGRRLES